MMPLSYWSKENCRKDLIKYFKTINKWARQCKNKLFETNDKKMKHRENTSIDVLSMIQQLRFILTIPRILAGDFEIKFQL